LKKDFFITQSENMYCAASINSLADLTVFFIREMYSSEIAHHVERHFSHEIRRPYESLRYFEGSYDQHSDESILQAQLWLRDHYAEQVKLQDLAAHCGMSMRTLNRRFKKSTGLTPLKYLQETRLGVARELIQSTNLSIGEIAYRVGYTDLGHFTALFKTLFDATPHEYRTTVRAKLFRMN
jgi:transcriptional regulator GlxA family with amidase domain